MKLSTFWRGKKVWRIIEPLFEGHPKDPFKKEGSWYAIANRIDELLELNSKNQVRTGQPKLLDTLHFRSRGYEVIDTPKNQYVISNFQFRSSWNILKRNEKEILIGKTDINFDIDGSSWTVDLIPALDALFKENGGMAISAESPFIYKDTSEDRVTTFIISEIEANKSERLWDEIQYIRMNIVISSP